MNYKSLEQKLQQDCYGAYIFGYCICLKCETECYSVAPVAALDNLECPNCHSRSLKLKYTSYEFTK
jgi:hypothetical protein